MRLNLSHNKSMLVINNLQSIMAMLNLVPGGFKHFLNVLLVCHLGGHRKLVWKIDSAFLISK